MNVSSLVPSADAIVKGVVITAISIIIINFAKPHLPAAFTNLLD